MANAKIILYKYKQLSNGENPVMLRISHKKKRALISIGGYSCRPDQWEEGISRFKRNYLKYKTRNKLLQNWEDKAENLLDEFNKPEGFSIMQFVNQFKRNEEKYTVFEYFDRHIKNLMETNKVGNAFFYKDTLSSLKKFTNERDIEFSDISIAFLKRWEMHLLKKGIAPNSISVYMRTLRSLYNNAIQEGFASQEEYPFGKNNYNIRKLEQETSKRAISKDQIIEIRDYPAEPGTKKYNAKSYFLFSFYCMGMNFTDMAYLKRSDIRDGRIHYQRRKTKNKKWFHIKLIPETVSILENYKGHNSEYIFPVLNDNIHKTEEQKKVRIKTALRDYNRALKLIGKDIGVDGLTSYVARHSWATVLKYKGVSTSIISEGLGHQTEKTTQVYLDSFGADVLDKTNEDILK